MEQSLFVQQVNGLFAQALDVHGAAADEVYHLPFYLRRTSLLIRAPPCRLSLHAHQFCAALRTLRREMVVVVQGRNALCLPRYLRDNLPAFLYKDHVSRADLQRADEVLVVQRGALDDSAGEVHRLEVRHRRYHARAPHLISYLA